MENTISIRNVLFGFLLISAMNLYSQTCKIALSSDKQTDNQYIICVGDKILDIVYSVSATAVEVSGLPKEYDAFFDSKAEKLTISGTSASFGAYTYTVSTLEKCLNTSKAIGVIVVGAGLLTNNNNQTVCNSSPIETIKYYVGKGINTFSITGLPKGISYKMIADDTLAIYGTTSKTGSFDYSIEFETSCKTKETLTGNIMVGGYGPLLFNDNQEICTGDGISEIEYKIAGGYASVSGLPGGVNGSINKTGDALIISGTPKQTGIFKYTVSTGEKSCVTPTLFYGTIRVGGGFISNNSSQKVCANSPIAPIEFYSVDGSASLFGLPNGFSLTPDPQILNKYVLSGTHGVEGTYNYTIVTGTKSCKEENNFSGTIVIKQITAKILTENISTIGKCNGYLEVVMDGTGAAPFTYLWNTGETAGVIKNACTGNYSVLITDVNNCSVKAKATVDVQPSKTEYVDLEAVVYSKGTSDQTTCDGVAAVKISGGVAPYAVTFGGDTILNVLDSYEFYDLCAGFYTVNVKDAKSTSSAFKFAVASPQNTYDNIEKERKTNIVFADTLVTDAVSSCLINFDRIDSIKITDYSILNDTTVEAEWSMYSDDIYLSLYIKYPYKLPGLYTLVMDIFCTNRSSSSSARALDDVLVEDRSAISTSVQSILNNKELVVYPNPFESTFTISGFKDVSRVSVFNALGIKVYDNEVAAGKAFIDLTYFPAGVYFIEAGNDSQKLHTKIIKQE
jgi:hypothetical protein